MPVSPERRKEAARRRRRVPRGAQGAGRFAEEGKQPIRKVSASSEEVSKIIEDNLKEISLEGAEHARGFDRTGKLLFSTTSNKYASVLLSEKQKESLHGNILIHNHPIDASFSPGDFDSIDSSGVAEAHVSSPGGFIFTLIPNHTSAKNQNEDAYYVLSMADTTFADTMEQMKKTTTPQDWDEEAESWDDIVQDEDMNDMFRLELSIKFSEQMAEKLGWKFSWRRV